jgi:hypothetical protein
MGVHNSIDFLKVNFLMLIKKNSPKLAKAILLTPKGKGIVTNKSKKGIKKLLVF